jgi:uncharacterized protein (DUF1684 family)
MRRLAALALLALMSCQQRHEQADAAYTQEIMQWRAKRAERLKSEDGWLSLVGLDWLKPGENALTLGGAPRGKVVLDAGKVTLIANADSGLQIDGKPVTAPVQLRDDGDGAQPPTVVQLGTIHFNVIKRNDRYGLRIKDANALTRTSFTRLNYFPVNPKWRVVAKFEPYNPQRHVKITNVLGMVSDEIAPGQLAFEVDGQTYRIQPILERGETDWFIIFKDATAGRETYGAARYVYAPPPGPDGKTVIDFNKAYNPPCAFTPFATCPLPPTQNKLPFRIDAGELKYRQGH